MNSGNINRTFRVEKLFGAQLDLRGNIYANHICIKCTDQYCKGNCYPFVCYQCLICGKKWWTHCNRGYPPPGVCRPCWSIQRELTNWVLALRVAQGKLQPHSKEWWDIFAKGIRPELYCYHTNEAIPFVARIIKGVCHQQIKEVSCNAPEVKDNNWNAYTLRASKKGRKSPPEEYSCCREDGTPRGSKQPSRRARQRRNKMWRKASRCPWNQEVMVTELPREWD